MPSPDNDCGTKEVVPCTNAYEHWAAQGPRDTRARNMEHTEAALVLGTGTPSHKGAKTEPPAVFRRNPKQELFLGLEDMVRPGGDDPFGDTDTANVELSLKTVEVLCNFLSIEWSTLEPRIVTIVSDGVVVTGAFVELLNVRPHKTSRTHVVWVKDVAHGMMRAISTSKVLVRVLFDGFDAVVSLMCFLCQTSLQRMHSLWRHGVKHCFSKCAGLGRCTTNLMW